MKTYCGFCGAKLLVLDERQTLYSTDTGKPYDAGWVRTLCPNRKGYGDMHHVDNHGWDEYVKRMEGKTIVFDPPPEKPRSKWPSLLMFTILAIFYAALIIASGWRWV
jgi:hypothetical protein